MAKRKATTFTTELKSKKEDGTYRVYIRVTHDRKTRFISTGYYVHEKKVKDGKVITDRTVLAKCLTLEEEYRTKLQRVDTSNWTVADIADYLTTDENNILFVPFCNDYITALSKEGRDKSASLCRTALNSFTEHFGKNISFQGIKAKDVNEWIQKLNKTKRAKELYPKHIRMMFKAGLKIYNDYENNIIRIQNRPFEIIEIPKGDIPEQRAIELEVLQKIFSYTPEGRGENCINRAQKALDVMKLSFYFVGMNACDLFNMKKSNFKNGKLCYNRTKTEKTSEHKGYTEIIVLPDIMDLFEKYSNKGEGDNLFDFGYNSHDNFCRGVNTGLKIICDQLKIDAVTTVCFRHTWATLCQVYFDMDDSKVGFCLAHASKERVTRKYLKKDYTPIDLLNIKVTNLVFHPERLKEGEIKKAEQKTLQEELKMVV